MGLAAGFPSSIYVMGVALAPSRCYHSMCQNWLHRPLLRFGLRVAALGSLRLALLGVCEGNRPANKLHACRSRA